MRFALDEQIESQPGAVRSVLERGESVPTLAADKTTYFCGIGTSLHACHIAVNWLRVLGGGKVRAVAISAHEFALHTDVREGDQVIVVSHRGSKLFPRMALERASQAGAITIAIVGEEAPAQVAEYRLETCPGESAGTHTVSYLSSLSVLAQLVGKMLGEAGRPLLTALQHVPEALERTLDQPAPVEVAEQLVGREPILITGMGSDAITACEAALKLKEGTYLWAEGMEIENALHGPPAAWRIGMGAISIIPGREDGGRTQLLQQVLRHIHVRSVTCGDVPGVDLPFAHVEELVRPLVAIVPLQRLTAEIARLRMSNPDVIHRDVEPWASMIGSITL